jgi:hypothetical protein
MILLHYVNVVSNFIRCIISPFSVLFTKDEIPVISVPALLYRVASECAGGTDHHRAIFLSVFPKPVTIAVLPCRAVYKSVRKNTHSTIVSQVRDCCVNISSLLWKENFNVGM